MRAKIVAVPLSALLSCTLGCSTLSRISSRSQPVQFHPASLSDQQLMSEINRTEARLAQLGVSSQYLAMTRPAPTYTLTGSSFYTGTFWSYGNMGNLTFQGNSIYRLTPDYGAQFFHTFAAFAVASQMQSLIQYRASLIDEAIARLNRRERESRTTVENFYEKYQDLKGREAVVACTAPWVQIENPSLSQDQLLDVIASRARSLVRQEGADLGGDWYGLVVQELTYPDGKKALCWNYLKANLSADGQKLAGVGQAATGERLLMVATCSGKTAVGTVRNTTLGLDFQVTANVEPTAIIADFSGKFPDLSVVGRAALVR